MVLVMIWYALPAKYLGGYQNCLTEQEMHQRFNSFVMFSVDKPHFYYASAESCRYLSLVYLLRQTIFFLFSSHICTCKIVTTEDTCVFSRYYFL